MAHDALQRAGHSPEVVRCYGFARLPDLTAGRKQVKRLSGDSRMPALVLDGGEVITGSQHIAEWASDNPMRAPGQ